MTRAVIRLILRFEYVNFFATVWQIRRKNE